MTTARQFLDFVHAFEKVKQLKLDRAPEDLLRDVPDDQFRLMVLAAAGLMKQCRDEAVRRGILESFKGVKP